MLSPAAFFVLLSNNHNTKNVHVSHTGRANLMICNIILHVSAAVVSRAIIESSAQSKLIRQSCYSAKIDRQNTQKVHVSYTGRANLMICNIMFYVSAAVVSRAIIESSIHIKVDTSVVLFCGNRLTLRMCIGVLLINYSNNHGANHITKKVHVSCTSRAN